MKNGGEVGMTSLSASIKAEDSQGAETTSLLAAKYHASGALAMKVQVI